MIDAKILDDISARLKAVLAESPARDIQNNLRATLSSIFARLDLVTREEFDVQAEVLARTRDKLVHLEARIAQLERAPSDEPHSARRRGIPVQQNWRGAGRFAHSNGTLSQLG